MIQDFRPGFSVENPTRPWLQSESPWREIARIEIPKQELVNELEAERAVINPWDTLPEHRPLGGINRLRLAVYLASIQARLRQQQ